MASVSFAFYTGIGAAEPTLNKLTKWLTGPYMHCEIVFAAARGQYAACGVYQGETTFFRKKSFAKNCWRWQTLNVTRRQEAIMRAFCRHQAASRIPFNRWGLLRCITPFPRKTDGRAWFCSELCVCCLQSAGLLVGEVASACTPTYLHQLLAAHGAYQGGGPGALLDHRIAQKKLRFTFRV